MFDKTYHTTNPLKQKVSIKEMRKFRSLSKIAIEITNLILSKPYNLTRDTCKIKSTGFYHNSNFTLITNLECMYTLRPTIFVNVQCFSIAIRNKYSGWRIWGVDFKQLSYAVTQANRK